VSERVGGSTKKRITSDIYHCDQWRKWESNGIGPNKADWKGGWFHRKKKDKK
jgi:hypothetical protein